MSFLTLFTAGLAALAPLASAYTTPTGDPTGNAIYEPGLNSIVPVGKVYTITWNPTTTGNIALVLLHGPSTNVVPIQTLVESMNNTGSYDWTPSTDLAPNKTYYGLELIVEGTGQYQYSTQFGISNPDYSSSSASTESATTTISVDIKTGGVIGATTAASTTEASTESSSSNGRAVAAATTSDASSSASATSTDSASSDASTSLVTSTKTSTKSSSASSGSSSASGSTSASASTSVPTGAASQLRATFGSLAVVAGFAVLAL